MIGDKVFARMKRQAKKGEFSLNIHLSGTASLIRTTLAAASTVARVAKSMGFNGSGVDVLRSNHGPVVIKVTHRPTFISLDMATNQDSAKRTVSVLEQKGERAIPKSEIVVDDSVQR